MVLNYIWIAFFLIAFVVAIGKLVIGGDTAVFTEIINASFASAKTGFEISLGLTGILSLWLGIMKIGSHDWRLPYSASFSRISQETIP